MSHSANISSTANEDKVSLGQKIAYALGGPVDIWGIWILVSMAYPLFNMELGMPPIYVAIILMSLRLWDGMIDPLMGCLSDNARTRWGRRRPFIFVGAILSGLTFPIMWWFPSDFSHVQILLWVIGSGIVFYTCFAMWAMPFQSMLMEMTPDYHERTRVASYRGLVQSVSSVLVGFCWWLALRPAFADTVTHAASSQNGMRYLSLIIGFLIMILGMIPALFVKERYYNACIQKTHQAKVGTLGSLGKTLHDKPFMILSCFTIMFVIGMSIYDSYGRYVGTYYVLSGDWNKSSEYQIYGTLIYAGCSLMFIPIFRVLSERIGKKMCLLISVAMVLLAALTTWFTFNPAYPWLMLSNTFLIGAGYAGLWLMIPSMLADVVDHDELSTGQRREGSFASVFSWVQKLSFSIGFLISAPLLDITGFRAELGAAQAQEALQNMRIGYLVIPAVVLVVAIVLLKAFSITPDEARRIRSELEAKRGKV